ncbi:wyosine base formation [Ophiostoma piceae UAMH 11346]|uniref:tRNA 4-demethylwyosine synthase (AdoMet-dependent) n=1 Tax=Ophiostoma piceae (strain UAMH 11346) TaxID=1262450 RepID=S3CAR2_OPHP1|nr:wyosine base formation [Ophiostoma piceae UAMH 11346]
MASTSWAFSPLLQQLIDSATDTWHAYRIPFLLATFATLVALRIYLQVTEKPDDKDGLLVFPKIYDADDKAQPSTEKPVVASEKVSLPVEVTPKKITTNGSAASTSKKNGATTSGPRRIKGELPKNSGSTAPAVIPERIQTIVFYSSVTGATAKIVRDYAEGLSKKLASIELPEDKAGKVFADAEVLDIADVDLDEYFITPPKKEGETEESAAATPTYFYLFLIPSYNIDCINDTFLEHLRETHHDFRIDTAPLAPLLGYSVFGFGDREGWPTEDEGFCFQAKELDKWMAKLTGRKRAYPMGCGNTKTDAMLRLGEWSEGIVDVLGMLARTGGLGSGVAGSGDPVESDEEDVSADEEEGEDGGIEYEDEEVLFNTEATSAASRAVNVKRLKKAGVVDDVEDLGRLLQSGKDDAATEEVATDSAANRAPIAIDFTSYGETAAPATKTVARRGPRKINGVVMPAPVVKEMVAKDSPTFKSLTKQGYAVVGSHSGVKICRWTKSALRGRGSCYKYSFYGINSHQCMETTPSLSCSNKCVFCWRHGTNPVGTTWRWVVDPPDLIFDGVKAGHYQKIKMMRGVPGVRAERFAEAMRIRHCALSLVGEPIFYPHINEFLDMLHGENISSFLVCNAQHPDQLAALHHVTQLYVSIDASNRETLRKIDRPLHRDFWERFQRCLEILREKRFKQRTVFRLTLVKGFNIDDEVRGYADLVEKALPCFIEVKGVTFCGTSTSAGVGLTMANVPFYHEVCEFVTALDAELNKRGLGYGLAAEHAHSCCVLIASERFRGKEDGKWHTVIDYDKFFELLRERGPDGDFTPEEYMGPATAEWATWGNGGFDPRDQRVDRKGRPIER